MPAPDALPVDQLLPRAIELLRKSPALVFKSPTGSGKTTRLPPALEAAGLGPVIVLQPRRISARAAAARMAHEAGEALGERFGYQVRFEKKVSARTRVTAMTEGLMLRRILADPFLEGVGCVVFDEFHERHLDGDIALALVRKIQVEVRPDLRIVILSATLETQALEAFLDAQVLSSEGRLFPVEVQHQAQRGREPLEQQVLRGVESLLEKTPGDLLVFLPGKAEIRRAMTTLAGLAQRQELDLHALHGELNPRAQDAALRRGPRRRVVLSTNLAESSVTVDGVSGVIDSGLARIPRFDPQHGLDKLELVRVSMQSVEQRRGRAGRQTPGINLRLWSPMEQNSFRAAQEPEVSRVDLAGAWLSLLDFGEQAPARFGWFEAPSEAAGARASGLLRALGASRPSTAAGCEEITPMGRELARLPLHPRLGRLLLEGARLGCAERAALASAMISERDAVRDVEDQMDSQRMHASDTLERVEWLEDYARGRGSQRIHAQGAKQIFAVRDQLLRLLKTPTRTSARDSDEALMRALFIAYADRLARRRGETARSKESKRTKTVARNARFQSAQGERALLTGGRGARLARECRVREDPLFVCIEMSGTGAEVLIRQASAVHKDWLAAEGYRRQLSFAFDSDKGDVRLLRETSWNGLMLHRVSLPPNERCDTDELEDALQRAASSNLEKAFDLQQEGFVQWIARWNSIAQWRPGLQLDPINPEAWLRLNLTELVRGKRSFAELRRIDLAKQLQVGLEYSLSKTLDELAPRRMPLPGGNSAAIVYAEGQPPVLAARIQHLFGLDRHPSVCAGQVPLLLHLCAPNRRPEQITSDLPGFWRGSYALVRKELKGRFPRHPWPEDPLNFQGEREPRRRPRRT